MRVSKLVKSVLENLSVAEAAKIPFPRVKELNFKVGFMTFGLSASVVLVVPMAE